MRDTEIEDLLRRLIEAAATGDQDALEEAASEVADRIGGVRTFEDVVDADGKTVERQSIEFERVLDSGTGFPEHILKRAFEPYVTTKSKGTGLGLAVVKKIADEHGTRVDIANRVVDGQVLGAQVSLSFAIDNVVPTPSASAGIPEERA